MPVDEIRENGYDLSINKYKEIEYEAVEYPSTLELMTKLDELDMEYGEIKENLRGLLK